MRYASRINSFISEGKDIEETINEIGTIEGIDYIDLNYPEHFAGRTVEEMRAILEKNNIRVNAINLRFRKEFMNGEFGNRDSRVSQKAVELCRESADLCKALDGRQMIIWLGFDGYDYSFQMAYEKTWAQMVKCFQEVCDYSKVPVSIEYKPYEERVHSVIDSFGTTMLMLQEVGRDNLGVTLDFCHMLMKKENPAFAAALLLERGKLFNLHLNDGEGHFDDGLIVGSVNLWKTVEVMYYLKKYKFNGVIYFDTFPKREKAAEECRANLRMCKAIEQLIDSYGMEKMQKVIDKNDGVLVSRMLVEIIN